MLPFGHAIYLARRNVVDVWISKREMRTIFFAEMIISYCLAAIIFFAADARIMFLAALGYAFVTLILMGINFAWKISGHGAGVAGPITAFVYVYGAKFALLFLLLVPMAWARVRLNAHTLWQVTAGSLIAVLVVLLEYTKLYPW